MPIAFWIVGSDVATIWMSRIAMNMPTHIAPKPTAVAAGLSAIVLVSGTCTITRLH